MQNRPICFNVRNAWHSAFRNVSLRRHLAQPDSGAGYALHFWKNCGAGASSRDRFHLGIARGCVVHTFAAAVGLSAVLAVSATDFATVRTIGAVYLIYLGTRLIWRRNDGPPDDSIRREHKSVGLSEGDPDQHFQSEGHPLLPRLHAAIHRTGKFNQISGLCRSWMLFHLHGHSVVSHAGVLRLPLYETIARERKINSRAEPRCRKLVRASRVTSGDGSEINLFTQSAVICLSTALLHENAQ